MCYVFPLVMRYQTGMTIVMRMMCLYTGGATFAHDKMCIILQMSCTSYVIG